MKPDPLVGIRGKGEEGAGPKGPAPDRREEERRTLAKMGAVDGLYHPVASHWNALVFNREGRLLRWRTFWANAARFPGRLACGLGLHRWRYKIRAGSIEGPVCTPHDMLRRCTRCNAYATRFRDQRRNGGWGPWRRVW